MTRDVGAGAPGLVDHLLPFGERLAGAEHGAMGLHRRCMLRRSSAVGVSPLAWRKRSRRASAQSALSLGRSGWLSPGLSDLGGAQAGGAAEHDEVDQRIGAEPVGAVHRNAGRFAERHQARHDRVGIAVGLGQHFAVIVRRDAAHVVVDGRQYRDRLLGHVDAGEDARALGDAGQALVQHLRVEMVEVQVDVVLVLADAAAFADLDRHGAADDVARGEVLGATAHSAP